MATASLPAKKIPLPPQVQIFNGAMERQMPLADYARTIDLHPDFLRQALTGRLQGADTQSVNALAKAINRDPEQMDWTAVLSDESFGMWLKRNMEGITQHALRARAQLDNQTLKRFLNGELLPDSDQAERISRALYIDRSEVARVVTASMAAASPAIASQKLAEAGSMDDRSNVSPRLDISTTADQPVTGTRRRRGSLRHANAEPASLLLAVEPTTINETASAALEPDMVATEDAPILRGKRPKRPSKPGVQIQAPVVASMAALSPHDAFSSVSPAATQDAGRNGDSTPATTPPPLDQELQPASQSMRVTKSRSRRQPNQAITSNLDAAVDPSTSLQNERQPSMEELPAGRPVVPAVEQADALLPAAPAKVIAEKETATRRSKQSTAHGLANVAAAEQTPAPSEMTMAADGMPAGGFVAEDKSFKRAGSRRRSTNIGSTAADVSSSGAVPASFAAEIAPSQPDRLGADAKMDRTVPSVTAEIAADTTILQLSSDEVRLIRHWRQLHPHGRRATLQYIGSLLVDD